MLFIVLLSGSIAQPFSVKKLYLKELSLMWLNSKEIYQRKQSFFSKIFIEFSEPRPNVFPNNYRATELSFAYLIIF